MRKGTLSGWLLVIVGLAACCWVANALYDRKASMTPYEAKTPTLFYAGFDKFLSNVSWMTLVQWQADGAPMSAPRADALYRKLNSLTNLDPLFANAYLDGALSLAPVKPDLSLKLLQKALRLGLDENWTVQFYAGLIQMNYLNNPLQAVPYLDAAAKLPDAPEYVQTMAIHARCRTIESDPLAALRTWHGFIKGLAPDQWVQRQVARGQIAEYAALAIADAEQKLKDVSEPAAREQLLAGREEARQIRNEVGAPEVVPNEEDFSPSTQPSEAPLPVPSV